MKNLDDQVWTLLQDDRFIRWVHSPDEATIAYWEKWMEENPDGIPVLFKAREIARDLAYTERPEDAEELAASIWAGIQHTLAVGDNIPHAPETIPNHPAIIRALPVRRNRQAWYWAAACLAAITGASLLLLHGHAPSIETQAWPPVASHMIRQDLQRTNLTATDQQVYLVDGSKITLQPGASIHHAAFLQKDKREVYLEGNAFFEIAKDADRPFYVYTKDLVVRVLGTSFKVTTNKENGDVAILVRTGKVSVFKKAGAAQQHLILEPDQQVLYKAQTRDLVQSTANKKDLTRDISLSAPAISFYFEEMPVAGIFQRLEDVYGIPLHFDDKTFSSCVITTSLADETFEEKLKIICAAIGATYRIDSDGVRIEGKPCK